MLIPLLLFEINTWTVLARKKTAKDFYSLQKGSVWLLSVKISVKMSVCKKVQLIKKKHFVKMFLAIGIGIGIYIHRFDHDGGYHTIRMRTGIDDTERSRLYI